MEYPESARNVTGTHEKRRRWRRAVSVLACAVVFCTTYALILPAITLSAEPKCGLEEHTHTEDCYETRLVCGQAEDPETDPAPAEAPETDPAGSQEAAGPAHVHTDACYEQVLTCEKPEHTHTDACWSDPAAAEDPKDWEPQDLTGDWNRDTLAIALAQEGYRPSEDYFTVDDAGEHIGYTRYGDWSGDPFGEWNLSFAAFCLHFAGAAAEAFPTETSAEAWRTALDALDLYQPLEGAIPGDLIFLDSDGDGEADRVGIFTGWQDAEPETAETAGAEASSEPETSAGPEQRFAVMEGDLDGEAAQALYDPEDAALLGRASPDEAADAWYLCGEKAHIHGDDCYDETGVLTCGKTVHIHSEGCQLPESRSFTYEDNDLLLTVTVLTPDPLPEGTELTVTEGDASTLAAEDADTEEGGQWLLRGLALTQNGQALEIADCRMTAEVALTERVFAPLAAEAAVLAEDAAPEAEVGVVLSAWQADEDAGLQEVESVLLEEETATLTVPVENGMLALYASSTTNPQYKVQYYAYIPRFAANGQTALSVFDTSSEANGGNARLPQNDGQNPEKKLYLNGSGSYTVATERKLTEMYSPNSFEYIKAPNPAYIDKLEENGNYQLKTVQVKNSDGSWTSYSAEDVHFTNRADVADTAKHIIYIAQGTVIRLIYDASDASFTAGATFYDYNISSGQNSDGKWRTGITGINSEGNYGTSADGKTTWRSYRDVLAFGNANTGTGMANYKFDGVYLNRHSGKNYGCAFGLVSGLTKGGDGTWSNGTIKYNDRLVAPNLFNDGDATGKQTYEGSSLTFKRVGDTYTLSSATLKDGGTINSLETFINPTNSNGTHTTIFTNSFWPMDGASKRTDPLFGANGDTTSYQGFASTDGNKGKWENESTTFPLSDDGQNHNSYFGMHYAVTFELTSDYVGPLEYYFFGDDDMWVFLDNTLVCDIGGVHSSVGEYVNLWDYIPKGTSGKHTLTFFYTERGASGSTCYMNFTLPSVSGATTQQESGDLRVEKEVVGLDNGQEFEFTVSFADQNGNQNPDDFVYDKYNANGSLKESNLIVHDEGRFTLRAGEYVIIKYVPFGTYYTITEAGTTDYSTSWRGNDGITHSGKTATGCILEGEINRTSVLHFTNTATPNTNLNVKKVGPDGNALSGATFTLTDSTGELVKFRVPETADGTYTVYHEELYPEIKENEGYYIALASDPQWGIGKVDGKAKLKQGDSRQVFYVRHEADGSYSFRTSDNNWLNLSGNDITPDGREILIYNEDKGTPPYRNELWYLLRNEDGSYRIQPKLAVVLGTSAVLDLNGASKEDNGKIQVWTGNGTSAQKWKLVPVNPAAKPETTTNLTVSSQGQLFLQDLIPGTYTLTETGVPAHYLGMQPITITVDRAGNITLVNNPEKLASVQKDGNSVLLQVLNKPENVKLTLTKKVVGRTGVTEEFPFKITYQLGTESGEFDIQLADGKSSTIEIPYGATVTITETKHDGFAVLFMNGEQELKTENGSCKIEKITGDVTITAVNSTGYELPSTGGGGTVRFTLAGILLMTGAAALTILRRRAREGGPE